MIAAGTQVRAQTNHVIALVQAGVATGSVDILETVGAPLVPFGYKTVAVVAIPIPGVTTKMTMAAGFDLGLALTAFGMRVLRKF